jgi:outer membrane murein-binding lipoprotein Lpp
MAVITLETISAQLSALASDVGILKSDVGTLKSDVAPLKSDVSILRSEVQARFNTIEARAMGLPIIGEAITVLQRDVRMLTAAVSAHQHDSRGSRAAAYGTGTDHRQANGAGGAHRAD